MGTGYTRNDASNNIANGNVIDAADLDGEFDAIEAAFSTSGHTHDGTSEEGGAITVVGPTQEFLGDGSSFYPKADAVYDLGKSTASFDIAYVENVNLAGTALTASGVEINYVDGVTSSIQTQLDNKLPLAGGTLTGNVNFGDNDKAIFGAGSDLQIYHDGSNSRIQDTATGSLILAGTNFYVNNTGDSKSYLAGLDGGTTPYVRLYYDGATRLDTTSTGIDVTGTATADNALFSGYIDFQTGGVNKGNIYTDASTMIINTQGTNTTLNTNGGNVGIGTSSPENKLHIFSGESGGAASLGVVTIEDDTHAYLQFLTPSTKEQGVLFGDSDNNVGAIAYSHVTDALAFTVNAAERMRIDASGNVGIGTSSPSTPLHIQPNSSGTITLGQQNLGNPAVFPTYTTSASYINSWLHGTGAGPYPRYVDLVSNGDGSSGGNIRLLTNPTGSSTAVERMRIDNSGNVGIGTSSPDTKLTVGTFGDTERAAAFNGGSILIDGGAASEIIMGDGNSAYMSIQTTDNATAMKIRNFSGSSDLVTIEREAGNVGIGTSSPTNGKLEVTHSSSTVPAGFFRNTSGSGDSPALTVQGGANNAAPNFSVLDYNGNTDFVVQGTGNVGIGTDSPSTELQVVGSSAADTGILVTNSRNGVGMALRLDNTNNGTNKGSGIKWESGGFETGAIITRSVGTAASGDAPGYMTFHTSNDGSEDLAERMRIDSSGFVVIGATAQGSQNAVTLSPTGHVQARKASGAAGFFDRLTNDGDIVQFRKAGTSVGSIGSYSSSYLYIGSLSGVDTHIGFVNGHVRPAGSDGSPLDNYLDLGHIVARWDDIYATNGTIQTSDATEKQDIATLTATEMLVGKRLSGLFKTFRWIDSVAENGANARTHTGTIAQDVQAAFTAEGLDAGDYSLFISTTWWETQTEVPAVEAVAEVTDEDGNVTTEAVEAKDAYTRTDTYETIEEAPEGATERTRMGIRYPELLCFVGAYNEQRFASIEARLTALEAN